MLQVQVEADRISIGERLIVSFQRTLRIPDDGREYPLPPGLGSFPVHRAIDYADRIPASWNEPNVFFIPMYQREALWLAFSGAYWKPNAVKVGVGNINAISGTSLDVPLHSDPQDYMVCPPQPWLDGINAGDMYIRQFVAMPLGQNYTIEHQLTSVEQVGGIQILVYEPRPGRFPDQAPPMAREGQLESPYHEAAPVQELGIAAGGKVKQGIYPDPYGIDTWDLEQWAGIVVHIVNGEQYSALTGLEPPPTPISPKTYTEYGLRWFEMYDESLGTIAAADSLSQVRSVSQEDLAREHADASDDASVDVPDAQIETLTPQQPRPDP